MSFFVFRYSLYQQIGQEQAPRRYQDHRYIIQTGQISSDSRTESGNNIPDVFHSSASLPA